LDDGNAGPTRIPQGAHELEVGWENQANSGYVITVAEGESLRGVIEVASCSTGYAILRVDEPFVIGMAEMPYESGISRPLAPILNSADSNAAPGYRILVRVGPNGSIDVGRLQQPVEPEQREDC
jgi:hypothetical protein